MMVTVNEGRSFMKTAASDFRKMAIETFERRIRLSLNNITVKQIYNYFLGNYETWNTIGLNHVIMSVGLEKKKFHIISLKGKHNTRFSLRYMNLYYVLKILKLLPLDENLVLKERILDLAAKVLKDA